MHPRVALGVLAPAVFVASWAVLGARKAGYSPVRDPISHLAAVGAGTSTRTAMTAGLLGYAVGIGAYGRALGDALPGSRAGAAVAVNALATAAVAATPVGSAVGGTPHAVAATTAYVSLAAVPLLAARSLAAQGRGRSAVVASTTVAIATGAGLVLSAIDASRTGLWQRAGLTIGDGWLVASAVALAATASSRRPDRPRTPG